MHGHEVCTFNIALNHHPIINNPRQVDRLLCEAWVANGFSFRSIEDPRLLKAIRAWVLAGPAYIPPKRKDLAGYLLDDAVGRVSERVMVSLEAAARTGGGATLVTDGMTHLRRPFTNMLVIHPSFGVLSLGVIDSTQHLGEGGVKDAEYVAEQIAATISKLPAGSISLLVTDGASVMVSACSIVRVQHRTVAVVQCHSHRVNLLFKDVADIPAVALVLDKARKVALVFKNRERPRAVLVGETMSHNGRALGTVVGGSTRMGTHFITAHRNLRLQPALEAAVRQQSIRALASVDEEVDEVVGFIEDKTFWRDVALLVDLLWPAMLLLRLLDSDTPVLGVVEHAWRRLVYKMESLKATVRWGDGSESERTISEEVVGAMRECVRGRAQGFKDIEYAAYLLNPGLWDVGVLTDDKAMDGFKKYCSDVVFSEDTGSTRVVAAQQQLVEYKQRTGAFAGADWTAAAAVGLTGKALRPATWWTLNGYKAPELLMVAVKALSQVASVGAAERGHKAHKFLHSKARNRLASDTASKLVTVHVALRTEDGLAEEEDEDGGVGKALECIAQWWAEEEEDAGGDLSMMDWGVGERVRVQQRKVFRAWVESWENENGKDKSDTAKAMFRKKYVGMKLRVEGEEEGEEELRLVKEIVWEKRKRGHGWQLRTVAVGHEEDEDDILDISFKSAPPLIAAAADENPDWDIRLLS